MSNSADKNIERTLSEITARVGIVEQDERFNDTDIAVEATSLELSFLWEEAAEMGLTWKQVGGGLQGNSGHTTANGKEVITSVSLSWWMIGGKKVLFWKARDVVEDGIINRKQAKDWIKKLCNENTEHFDGLGFRKLQHDLRPI